MSIVAYILAMFDRFEDQEYINWAKNIKARDCYRCQVCFVRGGNLHAHHMNAWNVFEEQRYDLDNGITLCTNCHDRFHSIFGKGDNTIFQFAKFKKLFIVCKETFFKTCKENFREIDSNSSVEKNNYKKQKDPDEIQEALLFGEEENYDDDS